MKTKKLKVPAHLSAEAKRLWRSTVESYAIDEQAAMILTAALEALDRRNEARQEIARGGAVVKDRFGQQKVSPWCAIERDSALSLYRAFRLLGMDLSQAGVTK
jgi:phage terminase small subunit